jgi:cob(I)alamin adenosyltransferase
MDEKGLVHIYCGEGKGKTTAALGLLLRSVGRGRKVVLVQFLKSQETGEIFALEKFEQVKVLRSMTKLPFYHQMNSEQRRQSQNINTELLESGFYEARKTGADLLVLDEIVGALTYGLLNQDDFFRYMNERENKLEVVLTGRNPNKELMEIADYISRIEKVRHPFDEGIVARDGIER